MGRKLTPVLIAAKEVWPDEHTWAKSENSFAPAFERWRRSIHSCRRPCYAVAELPLLAIVFNREWAFGWSSFRSSDRRAVNRVPRPCARRARIRLLFLRGVQRGVFPSGIRPLRGRECKKGRS